MAGSDPRAHHRHPARPLDERRHPDTPLCAEPCRGRRHRCTAPRPTLRRGRCRAGTGTTVLGAAGYRGSVLLWPDTFTNCLNPAVGQAAIELLEDADGESCYPRGGAVLRADLDQHRSTEPPQTGPTANSDGTGRARAGQRPRRRIGTQLCHRLSLRRRRTAARRSRRGTPAMPNSAWLVLAAMAFNLTRAGTLASSFHAKATTATLRRQLITVAARITRSARRNTLRLPATWPWADAWQRLFTAATGTTSPSMNSLGNRPQARPETSVETPNRSATRPRPPGTRPTSRSPTRHHQTAWCIRVNDPTTDIGAS